jgi:hypothetical protein
MVLTSLELLVKIILEPAVVAFGYVTSRSLHLVFPMFD